MSGRPLLVMGELSDAHRAVLEQDSRACGFEPIWCATAEAAAAKLSSSGFDVLLIDLMTPGAASVCVKARSKLTRGRFPIIALAEEADDAAFTKAFRAGADEVIRLSEPRQLSRRLGPLLRPSRLPPGRARGEALIIDADRNRADVLERVLADAGYRVDIARDELAAKLNVGRPHIKLVVADAGLPSIRSLFDQSRKKGARSVWVVRAKPELIPDVSRDFRPTEPVAVVSSFGPPDDVLFESNRLLDDSQKNQRSEARLLYGAVAQFESLEGSEFGFTYNIGPAGLYVRTLALPTADRISLDVKPPNRQLPLRLEGDVVWRRPFGPTHRESAPPGFGVRLTGGNVGEWGAAFREAYAMTIGTFNEDAMAPSARPLRKPSAPNLGAVRTKSESNLGAVRIKSEPSLGAVRTKSESNLGAVRTKSEPKLPAASAPAARAPMSSVDRLLEEALNSQAPEAAIDGAVPLTITGDSVEIDRAKIESAAEAAVKTAAAGSSEAAAKPPEPMAAGRPIAVVRESVPPDSAERVSVADLEPDVPRPAAPAPPRVVPPPPPRARHEEVTQPINLQPLAEQTRPSQVDTIAKAEPSRRQSADTSAKTERPAPIHPPKIGAKTLRLDLSAPLPAAPTHPEKKTEAEASPAISPFAKTMMAMEGPQGAAPPASSRSPGLPELPRIPPPPPPAAEITAAASGASTPNESRTSNAAVADPPTETATTFGMKEESDPGHPSATDVHVPARGARRGRMGVIVAAGITAGIAAGAFLALRPSTTAPPVTKRSTTAATAATPPAAKQNDAPAPMTAERKLPEPVPSAAAAPAPSAATSQQPSRAPTAAEPTPSSAELPPGHAFLFVESPLDTHVFVHGVDVGATNTTVISRCGPKFVRLGSAPGQWQSEGLPLKIKCGTTNRIKMP